MGSDRSPLYRSRESYKAKEAILRERFEQVAPMDFYRHLFPEGVFETEGMEGNTGLCNGIVRFRPEKAEYDQLKAERAARLHAAELKDASVAQIAADFGIEAVVDPQFDQKLTESLDALAQEFGAGKYHRPYEKLTTEKPWDRLVHDDLSQLEQAMGKAWAIMAPIGYYGKKANGVNASWLYAIVIDLDGVNVQKLKNLLKEISTGFLLEPTYIINSGHGVHLYYFLETPIALYNKRLSAITDFKNELTSRIWNPDTSTHRDRDAQPATQMYRVVGSLTKLGPGYPCTAYRMSGRRLSLDEINAYVAAKHAGREKVCLKFPEPKHSLEECKELYPQWYERVILGKEVKVTRKVRHPWLVENMKKLLLWYCHDGNRYNALRLFFVDAAYHGVPYQEAYDWAVSQLEELDSRTEKDDNAFTIADIDAAAGAYQQGVHPPRLDTIDSVLGSRLPRNKRNGQSRQAHLDDIRALMDAGRKPDVRIGAEHGISPGRPLGAKGKSRRRDAAEGVVRAYLQEHPDAGGGEVIKATGLSRRTVYKWLRAIQSEAGDPAQLLEGEQLSIEGD